MSHFSSTGLCVPSQHAVSRRGFLSDGALRTAGAVGVAGCFAADMGQSQLALCSVSPAACCVPVI